MIYQDRFRLFIKSIYFNTSKTTKQDRTSSNWKISISSDDLTMVTTFWVENVSFHQKGRIVFSYDAANEDFSDYFPILWKHKYWQKSGFQTGVRKRKMGFWHGKIISARTDSDLRYGLIGSTMQIKVTAKGKDFPREISGYGSIDVQKMINHFKSHRNKNFLTDGLATDVDLQGGFGGVAFELYPVTKTMRRNQRRSIARGRALSPYIVQKFLNKKLPDCCVVTLKQLLRCIKTHEKVITAWNLKGWSEKILDTAWITETAKKVRKEAYDKIKAELFPPIIPTDASIEGNTILLATLILTNTMEHLSFGHMMDHNGDGDLHDIWHDIYQNFSKFKEDAVKKAGGEQSLKRKLGAAALKLKW